MFLIGTEDIRLGQGTPHLDGIINHYFLFQNDLASSGHAFQMMARVTVIALNGYRVGFAYDMAERSQRRPNHTYRRYILSGVFA